MKKTIVLGDTHGLSFWKLITQIEKPDRVIFIGDYFDTKEDISGEDQIKNFKEIVEFKNKGGCEVIMLLGNHDYHYWPNINEHYSGYQFNLAPSISFVLDENKSHLKMAYQFDDFLFTHAGVSSVFMDKVFGEGRWDVESISGFLNEQFKYKPQTFSFGKYCSEDRMIDCYGDNVEQSPIWIRPRSLMKSNYDTLRKQIIQVVGHTTVEQIDIDGKSTGNRYWFIDCLGTSKQYMVINDNEISINKI